MSATLKATSKAGVAEATWKQKTENLIKTLTGTFSGRFDDEGEIVEWTGSATLARDRIDQHRSGERVRTRLGRSDGYRVGGSDRHRLPTDRHRKSRRSHRRRRGASRNRRPRSATRSILPFGFPGTLNTTWVSCCKTRTRRHSVQTRASARQPSRAATTSTAARPPLRRPRPTGSRLTAARPPSAPNPAKRTAGAGRSKARDRRSCCDSPLRQNALDAQPPPRAPADRARRPRPRRRRPSWRRWSASCGPPRPCRAAAAAQLDGWRRAALIEGVSRESETELPDPWINT